MAKVKSEPTEPTAAPPAFGAFFNVRQALAERSRLQAALDGAEAEDRAIQQALMNPDEGTRDILAQARTGHDGWLAPSIPAIFRDDGRKGGILPPYRLSPEQRRRELQGQLDLVNAGLRELARIFADKYHDGPCPAYWLIRTDDSGTPHAEPADLSDDLVTYLRLVFRQQPLHAPRLASDLEAALRTNGPVLRAEVVELIERHGDFYLHPAKRRQDVEPPPCCWQEPDRGGLVPERATA